MIDPTGLHIWGVIVPYVGIATLLVAFLAASVYVAADLGRITLSPRRAALLAALAGVVVFAFIYACAFDRAHITRHAAPWYLWVLAAFSWASLLFLLARFRWALRWVRRLLAAEHRAAAAETNALRAQLYAAEARVAMLEARALGAENDAEAERQRRLGDIAAAEARAVQDALNQRLGLHV